MMKFILGIVLALNCGQAAAQGAMPNPSMLGRPLFTPFALGTSLFAYWDAQNVSNISFNAGNVSSWTDRKSGIVASQATGANQPAWSATARNGKAGLTATSTQTLAFPTAGLPMGTAARMVAVAAFTTNAGWAFGYGNGTTSQWFGINAGGSGTSFGVEGNIFGTQIDPPISWNNVDHFVEFSGSGAGLALTIDGVSGGTSAAATNTTTTVSAFLFTSPNNAAGLAGTIQQVVITNALLSSGNQRKVEGWESFVDGKRGLNLPTTSPYRYRPPYTTDP